MKNILKVCSIAVVAVLFMGADSCYPEVQSVSGTKMTTVGKVQTATDGRNLINSFTPPVWELDN